MRIVRTRTESAIGSARGCESVTEKELANGIVKEIGITEGLAVVTEIEDRRIIEVAAKTGHIEIGAGIAIVIETDIGIGRNEDKSKNGDFLKVLYILKVNRFDFRRGSPYDYATELARERERQRRERE